MTALTEMISAKLTTRSGRTALASAARRRLTTRTTLGGVTESMDYLLGRNPNNISFVTGYGANAVQHPHHRFWANQPDNGYPAPPAGVISGGTNAAPADPVAVEKVGANPPSRRFIDHVDSYSTNEVAINWNAPLAWVTAYLAR